MGESSAGSPPAGIGVVPRGAPAPEGVRRLSVLLVHPSKYDDDGYVLRFVRGVLPTNTLADWFASAPTEPLAASAPTTPTTASENAA